MSLHIEYEFKLPMNIKEKRPLSRGLFAYVIVGIILRTIKHLSTDKVDGFIRRDI